jgi:hypothetical protein
MYLYVLRVALLWAFIICMIVSAVVTPLTTPGAQAVFDSLFRTPGVLLQVAAWITLVFGVIDFARTRYPNVCPPIAGITDKWHPNSLPPLDKAAMQGGKRRSFAQAVAEIFFQALFLGWLLLIPHYPFLILGPGAVFLQAGPYELAPVWWVFFGWIIALGILQIVWRCVDLARGTWQRQSRIEQIVLKVFGLIPVIILLTAPGRIYISLKNPAADQLQYGQSLIQIDKAIHLGF